MFYNTTQDEGNALIQSEKKTQSQDELVIWLFKAFNNDGMTPSKVWTSLIELRKIDRNTPLTSIRRSITTLTKDGRLSATERQEKGHYGKKEGIWQLPKVENNETQTKLF